MEEERDRGGEGFEEGDVGSGGRELDVGDRVRG